MNVKVRVHDFMPALQCGLAISVDMYPVCGLHCYRTAVTLLVECSEIYLADKRRKLWFLFPR